MQSETVTLLIGAVIGFFSALGIELIRHALDRNRTIRDRKFNEKKTKEEKLREFINANGSAGKTLAWLKLIETIEGGAHEKFTEDEVHKNVKTIRRPDNSPIEKFLLTQK